MNVGFHTKSVNMHFVLINVNIQYQITNEMCISFIYLHVYVCKGQCITFNAIKWLNHSFWITYVLAFNTPILCVSVSIQTYKHLNYTVCTNVYDKLLNMSPYTLIPPLTAFCRSTAPAHRSTRAHEEPLLSLWHVCVFKSSENPFRGLNSNEIDTSQIGKFAPT